MDSGTIGFVSRNGGNDDRWNIKMNVIFVMLLKVKGRRYKENIILGNQRRTVIRQDGIRSTQRHPIGDLQHVITSLNQIKFYLSHTHD